SDPSRDSRSSSHARNTRFSPGACTSSASSRRPDVPSPPTPTTFPTDNWPPPSTASARNPPGRSAWSGGFQNRPECLASSGAKELRRTSTSSVNPISTATSKATKYRRHPVPSFLGGSAGEGAVEERGEGSAFVTFLTTSAGGADTLVFRFSPTVSVTGTVNR